MELRDGILFLLSCLFSTGIKINKDLSEINPSQNVTTGLVFYEQFTNLQILASTITAVINHECYTSKYI